MVKIYLFSLMIGLALSGCSTVTTHKEGLYSRNTCFVKWMNSEHKIKYEKGKGLSREKKSEARLLIPILQNPAFIIADMNDNEYVLDGYNDKELYESFRNDVKKYLKMDSYNEDKLEMLYISSSKVIKKKDLELKIRKDSFEQVDCQEYEQSVFM